MHLFSSSVTTRRLCWPESATLIDHRVGKEYEAIKQALDRCVQEDRDRAILSSGERKILRFFEEFKEELIVENMRKCEDLISGTKIQAFLKQQKVKFEHELLENIIGVAVSPSGKELHNKELRHLFNKTWSENISIPLPPTLPSAEGPDINTDLENILLQHFKHHPNIGNKIIHRCCDETRKAGVHASCHYQNQCEEKGTESL